MGCLYKLGNKLYMKKIIIFFYENVIEIKVKVIYGRGSLMGKVVFRRN